MVIPQWFKDLEDRGFPLFKMDRPPNADSNKIVFAKYVSSDDLIEALGKDTINFKLLVLHSTM